MNRIGIFCSACDRIAPDYFDLACELGSWIGRKGKTLVYGGADLGLMKSIATAVKENGGRVIGVVPTLLEERGKVSPLLDVTFRTENLSDRKDILLRESDILVALPGGVGTLDEVFHVIASASMGYHSKHVVFYNINGFWDELLSALDRMVGQGFMRKPLSTYYTVATSIDEIKVLLQD